MWQFGILLFVMRLWCLFMVYLRRGIHGMFPLHLAALSGFSDCCRKLLSSGMLFRITTSVHCLFYSTTFYSVFSTSPIPLPWMNFQCNPKQTNKIPNLSNLQIHFLPSPGLNPWIQTDPMPECKQAGFFPGEAKAFTNSKARVSHTLTFCVWGKENLLCN